MPDSDQFVDKLLVIEVDVVRSLAFVALDETLESQRHQVLGHVDFEGIGQSVGGFAQLFLRRQKIAGKVENVLFALQPERLHVVRHVRRVKVEVDDGVGDAEGNGHVEQVQ